MNVWISGVHGDRGSADYEFRRQSVRLMAFQACRFSRLAVMYLTEID